MYALNPNQRKRQKMVLQLNNHRATRQIESKNTRQTLNSKNKALLNIEHDPTIKKKQKVMHDHGNSKNDNNDERNEDMNTDAINDVENDKENSDNGIFNSDDEDVVTDQKNNTQNNFAADEILGEGHLGLLQSHVRDTLFKNIKFLAPNHLETKGEIMQTVLKLLKYCEAKNGNLTAFVNACRMEIRRTMCSRRGYVKRQTGLSLKGKIFLTEIYLRYWYLSLIKMFLKLMKK